MMKMYVFDDAKPLMTRENYNRDFARIILEDGHDSWETISDGTICWFTGKWEGDPEFQDEFERVDIFYPICDASQVPVFLAYKTSIVRDPRVVQ